MGKPRPHRRGGSYELYKSHRITNWSYDPIDKKCLDKLKIGDIVRVCFLEKNDGFYKKYVRITRQLSRTHFMGVIDDPYFCDHYCNVCDRNANNYKIYCCEGDLDNKCDVHVHEACLIDCPKCNKPLKKVYIPHGNGSKLIFSKSNIVEIPNWTRNTERLFDQYGWYEPKEFFTACLTTVLKRYYC